MRTLHENYILSILVGKLRTAQEKHRSSYHTNSTFGTSFYAGMETALFDLLYDIATEKEGVLSSGYQIVPLTDEWES